MIKEEEEEEEEEEEQEQEELPRREQQRQLKIKDHCQNTKENEESHDVREASNAAATLD